MISVEDLKNEIITSDSGEIYVKYLTGNDVWYFKEKMKHVDYSNTYDTFKRYISKQLGINVNEIAIFGSAKVGVSLSPKVEKAFKPFRGNLDDKEGNSDIDLVLVSSSLYQKYWDARLNLYYEEDSTTPYASFAKCVFRKFIDMDHFPKEHVLYKEWHKKVDPFYKHLDITFEMAEHKVNYRIFESWQVVEDYYISGINRVKELIIRGDIK